MIRKLRSGKFWLKLIFGGFVTWLVLMSLGYAISVWGLSDQRIQSALQQAMPTGRTIQIGEITNRGWLPYPNVTLHNVSVSYPNRTTAQFKLKELHITLNWNSLFGHAKVKKLRLLQPEVTVARMHDNTWNIDDFYQNPRATSGIDDLEIIAGVLKVQETQHAYELSNVNASIENWQKPQSALHLAFDWNSTLMGKQQISLEAPIQKTANGFNSKNVRIKIDNTLPEVGAVTWYATGQMAHTWLEHHSEFSNIEINGSDEARLFKANFSIPKASWQKVWKLNQATGVAQWEDAQRRTSSATLKLAPTEISSQHFKSEDSSIDFLSKSSKETLSIKANGRFELHSDGQFMFNNWQFSSRQTDMNLQTDALFRSEGVINAFGNIHKQWNANWDGKFDDDMLKVELKANDDKHLEMNVVAQHLDLERYQNWLQAETTTKQAASEVEPSNVYGPQSAEKANSPTPATKATPSEWLSTWEKLPQDWRLTGSVDVANLVSKQMQLSQLHSDLELSRDTFKAFNLTAQAYGGNLQAALEIPRAESAANSLQLQLQDMQVQPWLLHWQEYNRLSGTGSLTLKATATGNHWDDIQNSLNGDFNFELKDGHFQGIALESLFEKTGNNNMQLKLEDGAETDFDVFKSHSTIKNGVFHTNTVDLNMPLGLQLSGQGRYHLPNNKMDYHLKFGQSLMDNATLPLRISGPLQQPMFALDYQSLTKGLTNSTDKSNAVKDALKRQWQLWQMPELPAAKP